MADTPRTCGARRRDGTPCRNRPMVGGVRCRMHGGASPQARRAAGERLLLLVDPAICALRESLRRTADPAVRLRAARDLLDRAGLRDVGAEMVTGEQLRDLLQRLTALFLEVVPDSDQRRAFAAGLRRLAPVAVVAGAHVPAAEPAGGNGLLT